jgi:dihydrolipoamide dehydrogenase
MLAHKAEEEAVACVERMAGQAGHVNYDVIPNVIYTEPEISSVGLTEAAAKEKGIDYVSGKFNFSANGRAIASDATDGFVKVIACKESDKLLGVQIIAKGASELIAPAVTHMEYGGSAEDLARTVHAHPTLSEAMKEAAMATAGQAIHS